MNDHTVSTTTLRAARLATDRLGLPWVPMLRAAGIAPEQADEPDGRIAQPALFRLWDALTAASEDEAFGIRLAADLPRGVMGVADYVAQNAATFGDALHHGVRYTRLVNDGAVCEVVEAGEEVLFTHTWRPLPPAWPRALLDWIVGYLGLTMERILGPGWHPTRVCFQNPKPADEGPYREVLPCAFEWSAPVNAVAFPKSTLSAPIPAADPQLQVIMQRYADEQLARLPAVEGFLEDVRREVATRLTEGAPLEDVASALGLSARSLQRRMRAEETTFQAFVATVRADLAASYLAEGQMPIGEIAFVLGYSEPSAFHRSFKRARGVTPRQYRADARAA